MKLYALDPIEEITILLLRIEQERHKVLFDLSYHKKATKRVKKMQQRIIQLGGNVDAKIKVE